ncbi:hypothetical protein LVJ94_17360 [Pendulispora rubella]|uniref:Glutathione S-transferase n=1 Tax=Pendulispora rubella TaxID=2741070 RepID=A0ABZ2LDH6_9BACT
MLFRRVSIVETPLVCLDFIENFDSDKSAHKLKAEARTLDGRWLGNAERRFENVEWIARADFTVADIMIACVLRSTRKTDLMKPFRRKQGAVRTILACEKRLRSQPIALRS